MSYFWYFTYTSRNSNGLVRPNQILVLFTELVTTESTAPVGNSMLQSLDLHYSFRATNRNKLTINQRRGCAGAFVLFCLELNALFTLKGRPMPQRCSLQKAEERKSHSTPQI